MTTRHALLVVSVLALGSLLTTPAWACSLHSAAPPVQENHDDRAELLLRGDHRNLRFGDGSSGTARLQEETLLLEGAFFLENGLGIGAHLPLIRRQIELPNESVQRLRGTGDLGLNLRFRRTARESRLTVLAQAGALLPTAPFVDELQGRPVHPDLQLGTGVPVPVVGVAAGLKLRDDLSLLASTDFLWAPTSPDDVRRSATLRLQPSLRWLPHRDLAIDLALPLRWEARTIVNQEADPATGGLLQEVTPSIAWRPGLFHLQAGANLPVIQLLRGHQRESPSLFLVAGLSIPFPEPPTALP